jgi:SCF-associated factor 1
MINAHLFANSCGRLHSSGLDANSHVWTFINWGRPFSLVSPLLDPMTPESTPVQVECGWGFSSALTKNGDVLVWFPFDRRMEQIIESHDNVMNAEHHKAAATADKAIPCSTWDLTLDPVKLPPLPLLPTLVEIKEDIRLIKIAGFDNNLIGLTNQGHVLKFNSLDNESATSRGVWTYVGCSCWSSNGSIFMRHKYSCRISANWINSCSTLFSPRRKTRQMLLLNLLRICRSPM